MHVIYLIDSLSHGGAEQSLLSMAPSILKRGVQLDVVYLHERPGLRERFIEIGVRVDNLGQATGTTRNLVGGFRLLRHRRPDLLHTTLFESDIAGRTAARFAGVPVASSVVNVGYSPPPGDAPAARRIKAAKAMLLDRTTIRWTSRVHAISDATARFATEQLHVPPDKIDIVPRGRDPDTLGMRTQQRRIKMRAQLGIPHDAPLVLFCGRNEEQKGLDILLRAFPHVVGTNSDAHLVLAGRPARIATVTDELIEGLPSGQVHSLGVRDDVPELLACCDVFVLPSRWEGLGSVLLEAMALEAPIVASDLPATRELLTHGETALLVPPGDVEALAEAIARTLDAPDQAGERAHRARAEFMESHTIDHVVDAIVLFWERALRGSFPVTL